MFNPFRLTKRKRLAIAASHKTAPLKGHAVKTAESVARKRRVAEIGPYATRRHRIKPKKYATKRRKLKKF